jgi:type IV pilus assembly protein PilM
MAKSDAVWGIDVGQSSLKALKCRLHNDGKRLVAEAFDFIEYPKILSQPDADAAELVSDAVEQLLSRNDIKGDKVAISVSGQSGLARFIKLPPVESKKIPDIVKFEARQQIPFALEDVVWDFQQMAGGSEEEGYTLETEVGLFAMKRDQVFRALRPFTTAGVEIDFIQLTPIALYNYIVFDQMQDLPPADQYDAENPPESVVVMSMGTDTTDLVITNGYRVWQRSIPLGGSHFTKAITKEMKVTFSKAEQMKRNAMKTDEAKAIFQAMRPVFTDLVTEVQRSISFFGSLNKTARLGRIIALGNTMKLRGLQKFLAQNLGMEVVEPEKFRGLTGKPVVESAAFEENHLAYAVCYGLCVQGVGEGALGTNLLPDEIFQDRFIKEKKPYAVAAVAAMLVGCAVGFTGYWRAWASAQEEDYKPALDAIGLMTNASQTAIKSFDDAKTELQGIANTGTNLAGIAEKRVLWAELMKAINECLPRNPPGELPKDIAKRNTLHITRMDCGYYKDLNVWFTDVSKEWQKQQPKKAAAAATQQPAASPNAETAPAEGQPPAQPNAAAAGDGAAPAGDAAAQPPATDTAATPPPDPNATLDPNAVADPNAATDAASTDAAATDAAATGEAAPVGPTGEGFVIEMEGHHFHNDDRNQGAVFVRNTLIANLQNKVIQLPVYDAQGRQGMASFTLKELGVDFPVIISDGRLESLQIDETGQILAQNDTYGGPAVAIPGVKPPITVQQFNFRVQFCWKPTPASKRLEARQPKAPSAGESNGVAVSAPPATPVATAAAATPTPVAPAPDGTVPNQAAPNQAAPNEAAPAPEPTLAPSTAEVAQKNEEATP